MTPSEALTAAWLNLECAEQTARDDATRYRLAEIRKALRVLDRPLIKTGRTPGNEKPASAN